MKNKQKFLKQRDLLKNSQNLRRFAHQTQTYQTHDNVSLDFVLAIQRTAEEECLILDDLFNRYHYDLILEELIHCRVEYLITLISFLSKIREDYIDTSVFVAPLFKLFRVVQKYSSDYEATSKIENDILSITNTVSSVHHTEAFHAHGNKQSSLYNCSSTWYDVCFSTLAMLLVNLIIKVPESLKHVNVSLLDCIQLSNSESWQIQYVSLSILYAHLLLEQKQTPSLSSSTMTKKSNQSNGKAVTNTGKATSSTGSGKAKLAQGGKVLPVNHAAKKAVANSPNAFKFDELFRNGFLRNLVAFCLHRVYAVRYLASQIITFLLDKAHSLQEGKAAIGISLQPNNASTNYLTQLWCSTIEQGIVAMLEYISQGVVINDFPAPSKPDNTIEADIDDNDTPVPPLREEVIAANCKHLFPETVIRHLARRYLYLMGEHLMDDLGTCKKLFSSLTFSGNHKLRLNIFMGMMFLSARNFSKKFRAVHSIANGVETIIQTPLLSMFNDFVKDIPEMKRLLKLLYHVVNTAWRYQQSQIQYEETVARNDTSIATQTDTKYGEGIVQEAMQRIHPIILVGNAGQQSVKMVCPSIAIIQTHCPQLAQTILVFHEKQLSFALKTYETLHFAQGDYLVDIMKCEKEITAIMNNLDDTDYYQIVGPYSLWQEIFSHMGGEYVLTSSLSRMSIQNIIELMRVAVLYNMNKILTQYVKALQQRINIQTVQTILQNIVYSSDATKESFGATWNVTILRQSLLKEGSMQLPLCEACLKTLLVELEFFLKKKKANEVEGLLRTLCQLIVVMFS